MTDDVRQLRLVVTAPDYDDALAFYRDVLGLPEEAAFESPDGRVTILSAGRATLELSDPAQADFIDEVEVGARVAGPLRVAFEVADTAGVTDRLARAGARVVAPPTLTPWSSLNARLDAPGGLHVTVFQNGADESAPRGEGEIMAGRVGAGPARIDAPVLLVEADQSWPVTAASLVADIEGALGDQALLVEHVGSTSVPGLAAKPVIDLVLAVRDPADEEAYVGALTRLGYDLAFREPEWHEHRLIKRTDPAVNLHVFGLGSTEIDRMLAFRDHLRADPDDRALYERTKRGLAKRRWEFVQQYADAKSPVVEEINGRALGRQSAAIDGTFVLAATGAAAAAELARRLGVPLLDTAAVMHAAAAAGSSLTPDAAAAVVLAVASTTPAAVLVGSGQTGAARVALPGRVVDLVDLMALPGAAGDLEVVVRAVRQLSRRRS